MFNKYLLIKKFIKNKQRIFFKTNSNKQDNSIYNTNNLK